MKRLQEMVDALKEKSDRLNGGLDPATAKDMHLLASCIKADLTRYLTKFILTEERR